MALTSRFPRFVFLYFQLEFGRGIKLAICVVTPETFFFKFIPANVLVATIQIKIIPEGNILVYSEGSKQNAQRVL